MNYNKYRNKWTECKQRHKHQSKKEACHCDLLMLLKENSQIKNYSCQKTYKLIVNNVLICKHKVDFEIITIADNILIQEVKGFKTKEWVIKKKLFNALYPDIIYEII